MSYAETAPDFTSDAIEPNIARGTCVALFAHDIGSAIDLDAAERLVTDAKQRERIRHKGRAPGYFQYSPAPLRISQSVEPISVGGVATTGAVDAVLYDFGAVSITYTLPLAGPWSGVLDLAVAFQETDALARDAVRRVASIQSVISDAIAKPGHSDFIEDYFIFEIAEFAEGANPETFIALHSARIAQLLRAERRTLSADEIRDALACRISYGADDAAVIDWNAALLLDREPDDVRSVLEFVNVELLEMRFLDLQLDRALDDAYSVLLRAPRVALSTYRADLHRIARLQADGTALFEGVNNALKLLGDQYLARLYRLASQRFHLGEWDAAILRKLQTLESIYDKLSDQAATRRMEALEWIIIVLIAVSIALPLFLGLAH